MIVNIVLKVLEPSSQKRARVPVASFHHDTGQQWTLWTRCKYESSFNYVNQRVAPPQRDRSGL